MPAPRSAEASPRPEENPQLPHDTSAVQPRNLGSFVAPQRARRPVQREESDDYGEVVVILNPSLRVIRGNCGLQWIVQPQYGQRNGKPIWQSLAFCATKEGLMLRLPKCGHGCDTEAWAVIAALPEYFPNSTAVIAMAQTKGHRHAWH